MVLRRTFLHCALSLSMTLACKASRQTDSDGLSTAGANATSQNIESLSRKSWAKIKNLQSKEKRFVYSPLSLYTGLHLHNILANEPIDNSLDALHKAFRATPGLTAANAIYTEASGNLLRTMQAQLSQIDSQGGINPTEYSTNALNQWILNQTQGKIKDLLTNPPPRPFGINAIYFKSQWINKFNPSSTSSMTFTTAKKQEVQAQMMQGDLKGFFSRPS